MYCLFYLPKNEEDKVLTGKCQKTPKGIGGLKNRH